MKAGHGIVHRAEALEARGRAVVARLVSGRRSWFDRYVLAPIARLALPRLVERSVPAHVAGGVGAGLGLLGLVLILFGWPAFGLLVIIAGTLGLGLGRRWPDCATNRVRRAPGLQRLPHWPGWRWRHWAGRIFECRARILARSWL